MIFYVVVTLGFSLFFVLVTKGATEANKNTGNPIMALEFIRKAADIEKIVKDNVEARNGLKTFLLLDSFAFIPLYLAFLLVMSFFSAGNFLRPDKQIISVSCFSCAGNV